MQTKDTRKKTEGDTKLNWTTGLVAFMDILGYKSLAQIQIEQIVEEIVESVTETPKITLNCLGDAVQQIAGKASNNDCPAKAILSSFEITVMSDSIIVSCQCPFVEKDVSATIDFIPILSLFLSYCSVLTNLLMEHNLLLRGAITYGRYFQKDNTFAGRPLIETYELAESIDAACLVLTPTLEHLCKLARSDCPKASISLCNRIPVPLKEIGEMLLYVVNTTPNGVYDDVVFENATVEQLNIKLQDKLYEVFTKYHQTLPIEVYRKYSNTVKIYTAILDFERIQSQESKLWIRRDRNQTPYTTSR